jgi:hypothetical protein
LSRLLHRKREIWDARITGNESTQPTNEKTLLTHNRAVFEVLAQKYFSEGRPHSGIVIAVRRSPIEIARRILKILNSVTSDEMENQIRYI